MAKIKRLWYSLDIEEKQTEIKYSLMHDRDECGKGKPMQGPRSRGHSHLSYEGR